MHPFSQSTSRRRAFAAGLLVCLALSACREADPLEAIRSQQAAGDFEGSVGPLQELLAERPDDSEANMLYGRALAFTQRQNLASWSLRKAMKDPKWLVPAGSQLAMLALGARDFNEVVEITGRILEREPENVPALLMRANAYAHWKKDPELALSDADRVLELDPNRVEAFEPRILALLELGRFEEARESLAEAGRRLVELGAAGDVLAWHCSTTAAFQAEGGDLEQARATWTACLDAHPINLEVVLSATSFYDASGEPQRSLEILQEALAGAPNSRVFRLAVAQRLSAMGEAAEGEAVLSDATRSKDPLQAAAAWVDLGEFRQAVGEQGAAADAFERALELAQQAGAVSPELSFKFADALVLADRLDRALEVAEGIPVLAQRQLIRARVAQERRDPARALELFDEALQLWPDNPWARYYAALAAEELGDFGRALQEYRYAVRISPGATDARTRGANLLLAQGQPNSALQMLYTGQGEAPLEIEGEVLSMRLSGLMGNVNAVAETLARIEQSHPAWAGRALAAAAEGLAARAGPAAALAMLATAPVEFSEPRHAPALRALVRFSHEAGEAAGARTALQTIIASAPDSSTLQEIRGLDLELSGAPPEAVQAAYERALALGPGNAQALAGLGRLASVGDPEAALDFFDRAAAADPSDPQLKFEAAKLLVAMGKPEQAQERLDALLLEHPLAADAAAERARLDLERGISTPQTLERARRAARFGGGAEALDLLDQLSAGATSPNRPRSR